MRPHSLMTTAAAALLLWQAGPLNAQEAETQETVRVSVGGTIVEIPPELAAEVCGLDVETLRADMAALEAGAGRPDSAAEDGATAEPDMTDTSAEAPLAATEPDAAAEAGSEASLDEADAVDPDATTTNDEVAMADAGDASGAATSVDPTAPLPTADAVCEIDRDTAEQFGLPAPD